MYKVWGADRSRTNEREGGGERKKELYNIHYLVKESLENPVLDSLVKDHSVQGGKKKIEFSY